MVGGRGIREVEEDGGGCGVRCGITVHPSYAGSSNDTNPRPSP